MENTTNQASERKMPHNVKRALRVRLADMTKKDKQPLIYSLVHVTEDKAIGLQVSEIYVDHLIKKFPEYGIDVLNKRRVKLLTTKGSVIKGQDWVILSLRLIDESDIGQLQVVKWEPATEDQIPT